MPIFGQPKCPILPLLWLTRLSHATDRNWIDMAVLHARTNGAKEAGLHSVVIDIDLFRELTVSFRCDHRVHSQLVVKGNGERFLLCECGYYQPVFPSDDIQFRPEKEPIYLQ